VSHTQTGSDALSLLVKAPKLKGFQSNEFQMRSLMQNSNVKMMQGDGTGRKCDTSGDGIGSA
jgi:hypothetical protein